jgi:hypothetical protein
LSTKAKVVLTSAAIVILAGVLWAYFARAGSLLTLPGVIFDSGCSGKFHGGFGDRRDFILIVGASWSFWMLPVLIIWCLFRLLRRPRVPPSSVASAEEFSRLLAEHRKHDA